MGQLLEVLNLLTLDKGCIQRRMQQYLADGELNSTRTDPVSCGNACPICKKSWYDWFRPLRKNGLMLWLRLVEGIPCAATFDNIVEKVWNKEHCVLAIFDRVQSGIRKYNVEAMILQLNAAQLIGIKRRGDQLEWHIRRKFGGNGLPMFSYEDEECWSGVRLESADKPRNHKLSD